MTTAIHISRQLANQLLRQAQQHTEREVGGLIGRRQGAPDTLYPLDNIATDPGAHYRPASEAYQLAMNLMQQRGETSFAIYYSHPHAPAEPTLDDLAQAGTLPPLHLIISLNTVGVLELRAFRLDQGAVEALALTIED